MPLPAPGGPVRIGVALEHAAQLCGKLVVDRGAQQVLPACEHLPDTFVGDLSFALFALDGEAAGVDKYLADLPLPVREEDEACRGTQDHRHRYGPGQPQGSRSVTDLAGRPGDRGSGDEGGYRAEKGAGNREDGSPSASDDDGGFQGCG